jgi:hypothetical protein
LPELLIIVVEASPMLAKFLQAVLVYVLDSIKEQAVSSYSESIDLPKAPIPMG